MDVYFFISQRLQKIRYFYDTAAAAFTENIRKIEEGDEPYDAPPNDYNSESGEPPFMDDWLANKEGLTLLGHAGTAMVQIALKLYLDAYKQEVDRFEGTQNWVRGDGKKTRGENWFSVDRGIFLDVLGIDWTEFGDKIGILEQIALARDDIFHQRDIWSIEVSQSATHFSKYTESFFADEQYLAHYRRAGRVFPGGTWTIDVSPERMHKALDLVDAFCQFMESKWLSWRRKSRC